MTAYAIVGNVLLLRVFLILLYRSLAPVSYFPLNFFFCTKYPEEVFVQVVELLHHPRQNILQTNPPCGYLLHHASSLEICKGFHLKIILDSFRGESLEKPSKSMTNWSNSTSDSNVSTFSRSKNELEHA